MSVLDDQLAYVEVRITRAVREATGISEELAAAAGRAALVQTLRDLSGTRPYVRKAFRATLLRKVVLEEYNGTNRVELMRKYSLSRATFYRMTGEARD